MTKEMRAHLTLVGKDCYGPNKSNGIYETTDKQGNKWRLSRHHWVCPTSHWAWRAECPGKKTLYDDGLESLLYTLGLIEYK